VKYFQRLVRELQTGTIKKHLPGQRVEPPTLLSRTTVLGKRLCYVEMGFEQTGTPILFVHGFGGYFLDWARVMVPVSKHSRVIAIDLPGWGFSEPPDEEQDGIEFHIRAIEEFLKIKKFSKVKIVGLSYGGALAWGAAAMKKEFVEEVVLINSMPPNPIRHMGSPLFRFIFSINRFWPLARMGHLFLTRMQYKMICIENLKHRRLLDSFYVKMGYLLLKQPHIAHTLHSFAQLAVKIDWDGWEEKLKKINVPVTILQGEDDKIFPPAASKYLRKLIPNSNYIQVKDCGHAMMFDKPRKVAKYLIYGRILT